MLRSDILSIVISVKTYPEHPAIAVFILNIPPSMTQYKIPGNDSNGPKNMAKLRSVPYICSNRAQRGMNAARFIRQCIREKWTSGYVVRRDNSNFHSDEGVSQKSSLM